MMLPLWTRGPIDVSLRTIALCALVALGLPHGSQAASRIDPARLAPKSAIAAPSGAATLCHRYGWACSGSGAAIAPSDLLHHARRVNTAVNARTRELSDRSQYGIEEMWALPTRRGGDCEDFALEKKRRLIAAGLPARSLLIATVLDQRRNSHAVLVLRTEQGDFVLDNLRSGILDWRRTGYSFLKMQNPERPARWDAILAGGVFGRV
ncbi:hypothetical protein DEA8626_01559 [Defluviimonas aquaemixtae]|uniref:Transglutaminase n=1 Tax=Albidovulum aquaemixtae TaxID=1542388 RepID=A0A2R8B601_9RHOB|nr:transglutaminase-like cysteine peptidase [Defluviimonas aquaemixtae]SPH18029.1 hypothetical protein DEA8626_01559 [Defluviimonas aquaemixtae]